MQIVALGNSFHVLQISNLLNVSLERVKQIFDANPFQLFRIVKFDIPTFSRNAVNSGFPGLAAQKEFC